MQFRYIILVLFFFACSSSQKEEIKQISPTVEVKKANGIYRLYRHGKPYFIKGASGYEQPKKLAKYGGNSMRTWSLHNAQEILDEAHEHGLTVTLGIEIGKQFWGVDFNYWNFKSVDKKIEELRESIIQFKDHPALLMWGIGNEVHLFGGNKFAIYRTINEIAKMIHDTDPNHPVMTAVHLADKPSKYFSTKTFLPDVDILGFNAFDRLPNIFDKVYGRTGWNEGYILSEWGPSGHWESNTTEWGAPRELSSTQKAAMIADRWGIIKKDSVNYLGGYAFYWGHKYEITHTWFSMFSEEGFETESVKILEYIWTDNYSENYPPLIDSLFINPFVKNSNIYLEADSIYSAEIFAHDLDNDNLTFRWELRPEEADFYESGVFKYNMRHLLFPDNCPSIKFQVPKEEGGYRLFSFVYDGHNNVASHNIPFYVVVK